VRRLRAKLGDALPLETLRGSGYKLRAPDTEEHKGRGGNGERPERPERVDENEEHVEEEAG
ncbi:MAG: DNA-binding response regulator, partial [Polyangiaceae bacterium]